MTDAEFAGVGPSFAAYLRAFQRHAGLPPTARHFEEYCRGLLSDEPRKTVEPLALRAGTTVRTLPVFLKDGDWDEDAMGTTLRRKHARAFAVEPDPLRLGTIGLIDETSVVKKGTQTPGVQRQYLGCVGKVDNGIVTVHLGACRGDLKALLDADLFVPKAWAADRPRCQAAGLPDDVGHAAKWKLAIWQWVQARQDGFTFNWLTFDEGYGRVGAFLWVLDTSGQRYVGEVPVNYRVAVRDGGKRIEVRQHLQATARKGWKRWVHRHESGGVAVWKYRGCEVFAARHRQRLIVAVNVATGEVKYFVSNELRRSLRTLLRVAFRRATVEHLFRLVKQETGFTHFEGRNYRALLRHLTMALVVMGFASLQAAKLRKKTPK
jgi:SRSO17 transposase